MNDLFFELIQVSLGKQICLSHTPTVDEWRGLYEIAKKQSMVGICFAGVQRLQSQRQEPPEMTYLTWMGMAAKIQQRNETVNRQCVELQAKLSADGIRSSILKGQGVGALYDKHLQYLRQSGDIDIYVDCGREKAIGYARKLQGDVDWDYKHVHLKVFQDPLTCSGEPTEVEMHYVPEVFLNLWKNRKLQKWFKEHEGQMFTQQNELMIPSVEFNLFYILLHTYRHFLYEGVGLRQLMDYFFVLHTVQTKKANVSTVGTSGACDSKVLEFQDLLKGFGMMRFTKGVMWIMKSVFRLDARHVICEPDEKEGYYILIKVMTGGNFGHHDERLMNNSKGKCSAIRKILKHNWHMLVHYPSDAIWAPVWIVYHWCWKKLNRI